MVDASEAASLDASPGHCHLTVNFNAVEFEPHVMVFSDRGRRARCSVYIRRVHQDAIRAV
jgi:hypothetical protein